MAAAVVASKAVDDSDDESDAVAFINPVVVAAVVVDSDEQRWRPSEWLKSIFGWGRGSRSRDAVDLPVAAGRTNWLISALLRSALRQLPVEIRERWREEWCEHRGHLHGWRLAWWALWLRATATQTGREYQRARLPQGGG
ncbi:hypothetical protein KRM28CT15_69420 [Krasilnikovia sp. M28-CT-15]